MKNVNYLDCKRVDTAISRAKKLLIERVKTDGLYEYLGQKEIREIEERFVDLSDYSEEMNIIRAKINEFSNWCMTYKEEG